MIPVAVTDIAPAAFEGSDPLIICEEGSRAHAFAEEQGLQYAFGE